MGIFQAFRIKHFLPAGLDGGDNRAPALIGTLLAFRAGAACAAALRGR